LLVLVFLTPKVVPPTCNVPILISHQMNRQY
jgi:hypothetical protein